MSGEVEHHLFSILVYVYDAPGDLVAFVDQEGNRTEFVYDQKHYLIEHVH